MKNILKKNITFSSLLLFLFLIFTGCSSQSSYQKKQMQWLKSSNALPVLCTTEMIEALVSRIGGSYVKTLPLVYGELDPHSYQMVKGDKQKFDQAHIVFCNGLELEHGPSLKSALGKHSDVVFLADLLKKIEYHSFFLLHIQQ
jgi:manganese/zinc/iron transport system substrate-binding protein